MDQDFLRVTSTAEFTPNTMKTVQFRGEEVVIANVGGEYYAIEALCKHAQWNLSEGSLEDGKIVCAGHGAIWDVKTGNASFPRPLPALSTYEVKVEGRDLLLKARK
ncbi:MAG: Rieske (2Fe-2S) protein [Nitrososphaerales archaeon]